MTVFVKSKIAPVAVREGTMEVVMRLIQEATLMPELKLTCQIVAALLGGSPTIRSGFLEQKAHEQITNLVKRLVAPSDSEIHARMTAVMRVVIAACKKCEPAKCK